MKKWTYLVATLLLTGATPLFTGCVDNDEPAGIEELRGAKAELLSAKAAVEAAKVATEQANAAYRNAEAELKKAQVAYQEALNAKLNAETEAAKAEAEQKLAEAKASAERAAKEWELKYKGMEAQYQALLVQLTLGKSQAMDRALKSYKDDVNSKKSALDAAAEGLRIAQRNLADAFADLEEDEAKKDLYLRDYKKLVILKSREKMAAQEALEEAQKLYEEASNVQYSDLAVKRDELEQKVEDLDKQIADLSLAAAEKIYEYETTIIAEYNKHQKALQESGDAEINIPAFELKVNGALPLGQQGSFDAKEAKYSLNDETAYFARKAQLEMLVRTVNSWVRTENDDLWTTERIAKLQQELEVINADLEETKKVWANAVAAYKTGVADKTDPTKVDGYKDLSDAIDVYNKAAEAWNAIYVKIAEAEAKIEAAEDAFTAKRDEILAKQKEDVNAENADYNDKLGKIDAQAEETFNNLEKVYTEAKAKYDKLTKELAELEAVKDDKPEEYAKKAAEWSDARVALDAAEDARLGSKEEIATSLRNDLVLAYAANLSKINNAANTKVNEAKEVRDKAVEEQNKVIASINANDLKVAKENLDAAVKASIEKFKAFRTNAGGEYAKVALNGVQRIKNAAYNSTDEKGNKIAKALDVKELTVLDKAALTVAINELSNILYGTYIFTQGSYGDFEARLQELSVDEIKTYAQKEIEKHAEEMFSVGENGNIDANIVSINDYLRIYSMFGVTGEQISMKALIDLAKGWITNDSAVAEMVKKTQEALDNLVAANEKAETAYEESTKALEEEWNSIDEKMQATLLPVEEARAGKAPLKQLLRAYENAIIDYVFAGEDYAQFDKEYKEYYVATMKRLAEDAEIKLYDAETALMKAEQAVKDFESGKLSSYELAQDALEDAQAAYKLAEENYNAALSALDAKMDELGIKE